MWQAGTWTPLHAARCGMWWRWEAYNTVSCSQGPGLQPVELGQTEVEWNQRLCAVPGMTLAAAVQCGEGRDTAGMGEWHWSWFPCIEVWLWPSFKLSNVSWADSSHCSSKLHCSSLKGAFKIQAFSWYFARPPSERLFFY